MTWTDVVFAHWRYDVDAVQRLLPPPLTVQPYDGSAWVGLVLLHLTVAPPAGPSVPWLARFAEVNVRTYATDLSGRSAIWFFSLDADRLAAVVTARAATGLPYFWSQVRRHRSGDHVSYSARRRWPAPSGAGTSTAAEFGRDLAPTEVTQFDNYLTARFALWSTFGPQLIRIEAEHPPWPLRAALLRVDRLDLLTAAGLPPPTGEPIVHASDGVSVSIGWPRRITRSERRPPDRSPHGR
jgi:uncharacterized protein YqjF (DUF2071 family)